MTALKLLCTAIELIKVSHSKNSEHKEVVLLENFYHYNAGNFHLFSTGIDSGRRVQVFADSSIRLGLSSTAITHNIAPDLEMGTFDDGSGYDIDDELECSVAAQVGFMQDQWYIEQESGAENDGVKLYLLAENGSKWYLRAHFQGTRVDLVCEDYVNNIRYVS